MTNANLIDVQTDDDSQVETPKSPAAVPEFKIIGIGASAGGLKALKTLFGEMPADLGVAFVVVVHLSPEHKSLLAELLQPHCRMPVEQVNGDVKLEPNHVYVIPPAANLNTIDTHLRLSDLEEARYERAPIDHFFRTLAETHGGESVGVILTGTGSDGTLGLRWIKDRGGVTIAQSPSDAEFDGMPRSAIASGEVDLVMPIHEIPRHLKALVETVPQIPEPVEVDRRGEEQDRTLQKIFAQIRARTGHNFNQYKTSTIMRRIRRRMQLQQMAQLDDYLELLRNDRQEVGQLFEDLLITVTEFFRDGEVFELLERSVIPRLFEGKKEGDRVRVWSVGCSTGEEAYSLAMLLLEEADRQNVSPTIQIFATDLHDKSLKTAREGLYPESIATNISPERLKRFFVKDNGSYRVRKEVRELVVFAPHNLMKDPPFSHVDLVVCRNLLIYLQRPVQQEIIVLFHYALNEDGLLLLGSAETIDDSDLFICEEKKQCLYRRRNVPTRDPRLPMFAIPRRHGVAVEDREPHEQPVSFGALHAKVVEQYAPPSVLLSQTHEIVHYSARAGRYFGLPGGNPTNNVFKLLLEPLRVELRGTLHEAKERGQSARSRPIAVTMDGRQRFVVLRVQPATDAGMDGFVLVIFDEQEEPHALPQASDNGDPSPAALELEAELQMSKQRLQAVIEEYETGQEEMQASNEELQSANEELRSTLEELETSKEELQSMNEELATVNQENRHRVEELSQLSSDLANLLAATDIATLFLDRELRIVRFTPQVGELFNIRHSDRGRPLSDLTHRLGDSDLFSDARSVLQRLIPVEREMKCENGRWYLSRVLPYRTAEDRIDGVVVTLIDLTQQKSTEVALRESEERFRVLVQASSQAVWETDADGQVADDSPSWRAFTGQTREQFLGDGWLDAVHPHDRDETERQWREALAGERYVDLEFRVQTRGGDWKWTNARAAPIRDESGTILKWVAMNLDVTERRRAQEALHEADKRKDEFLATLAHELRNPLAPIASGLELLRAIGRDAEGWEDIRGTMERQVKHLVRLVDDLMDVSRITRGKLKLRKAPVNLADVVRDAVAETRPLIDKAGHELTLELPDEPITLDADAARLTQVVSNLLSNAAKYTPQAGRIRLSAGRDGDDAVIRVQDSGVGISDKMLNHIFEMFAQIEEEQGTGYTGLGIGLTLVKSLVEMHGGAIAVHSEGPGRGSEFAVRLPIRHETKARQSPAAHNAAELAGHRVLVVDDNQSAAKMIFKMMQVFGNEARMAHSGEDALAVAEEFRPDIILLDIGMPGMDGCEAARRIRRQPWGESVILVAVTGWGQEQDKRKTKAAGFNHHLVKPADRSDLEAILTATQRVESRELRVES